MTPSTAPTRIDKPWGYELHWAKTERYVGKLLHIKKGEALSLQYHRQKEETMFVQAGRLLLELRRDGAVERREILPGDCVHLPPTTVHRLTAVEDSDVFEVSTPELDDVVRLEDRYGR